MKCEPSTSNWDGRLRRRRVGLCSGALYLQNRPRTSRRCEKGQSAARIDSSVPSMPRSHRWMVVTTPMRLMFMPSCHSPGNSEGVMS